MSAEQAIDHKCPDQVGVTRGEALADQLRCNLGPYDKSVEVKPPVVGGDGADPDGDGGQVRRRRRRRRERRDSLFPASLLTARYTDRRGLSECLQAEAHQAPQKGREQEKEHVRQKDKKDN